MICEAKLIGPWKFPAWMKRSCESLAGSKYDLEEAVMSESAWMSVANLIHMIASSKMYVRVNMHETDISHCLQVRFTPGIYQQGLPCGVWTFAQ